MKDIKVTDLPPEKMQKALRSKDGYTKITLGGEDREFYLGGLAYDLAEEAGVDLADVFDVLDQADSLSEDDLDPETANEISTASTWLFYLGMKPFDEDLEPAEVKLALEGLSEEEMEGLLNEVGLAPEDEGDLVGKEHGEPERAAQSSPRTETFKEVPA